MPPVTWWFCQGGYRKRERDYRFMVAFFRIREAEHELPDRHFMLMSLLDVNEERHHRRSWLDPDTVESVRELVDRGEPLSYGNLDRQMTDAVLRELVEYGPPSPMEVRAKPTVTVGSSGFEMRWEDVCLKWRDHTVTFSFDESFSGDHCQLMCTSDTPMLDLGSLGAPRLRKTSYHTFPRMRLSGTCGEVDVHGSAWFDYQTATADEWFMIPDPTSETASRMIGWEWLGANFDDGSDWLILCHRDMQSRKVVDRFAVLRTADGDVTVEQDFIMKPVRWWTSTSSHIRYPIEWEFDFPSGDRVFRFVPHVDDQEIRTGGMGRNIWEGSGTLQGLGKDAKPIGRGRLELRGYGLIFDFKQYSEAFIDRIDRSMAAFLPRTLDEEDIGALVGPPVWEYDVHALSDAISKPVWDLLDRGGKHWRPMFGLLLLETLGVAAGQYEDLIANVIELNHNGSLIIDDIEDDSLIRRGTQCIHLRYGIDVAINAGNSLYFLPYLLLGRDYGLSDAQLVSLYRIIVNFQVKAHFGQGQDIQWSKRVNRKWLNERLSNGLSDQALQMYAMKTAAATQGTAEAACVIAGAGQEVRDAYAAFGRTFGVAFQVIDDTLNFSSSPKWTKVCGEDLASGKPTYVIIRALERLNGKKRDRLADILSKHAAGENPDEVQEGIALVRESGALEEGKQMATHMLAEEWKHFSRYAHPSEPKSMLRMMTAGLLRTEEDY